MDAPIETLIHAPEHVWISSFIGQKGELPDFILHAFIRILPLQIVPDGFAPMEIPLPMRGTGKIWQARELRTCMPGGPMGRKAH